MQNISILVLEPGASGWDALGHVLSWAVLFAIPAASLIGLIAIAAGLLELAPMWIGLLAILVVIFLYGAARVREDIQKSPRG